MDRITKILSNVPFVPLILASASPQRNRLLKTLKIPFRVLPSRISEKSRTRDPRKLTMELALKKAKAVARKVPKGSWVLGADTIVVCRGRIIGKPKSKKDSLRILRILNGRRQKVYTGLALVRTGEKRYLTGVSLTKLKARKLDEERLQRLAGKHPDKAGSYAIQDRQDPFIQKRTGPLDNVIGFPRKTFLEMLKKIRKSP